MGLRGYMGEHVRWLIGTVIAVAALLVSFLAWQYPKAPQAASAASGATPGVASSASISPKPTVKNVALTQVQVGDCLGGPNLVKMINTNGNYWPNTVEVTSCNVNHIGEVFFAKGGLSESQANSEWEALCDNAFMSYVGDSSEYSVYSVFANTAESGSSFSLQCFAIYEKSAKPGYKTLDRSIKGTKI